MRHAPVLFDYTAILDLQVSVADLKSDLAPLAISSVKEVEVKGGRKALAM